MLAINIAISVGSIVNLFLVLLVGDANYGYSFGFEKFSPAIRVSATTALFILFVVTSLKNRFIKFDYFIVATGVYAINGIISGVFRFGFSYEFLRHTFGAATIFTAYLTGIALSDQIVKSSRALTTWAYITLAVTFLVFIACIPTMSSYAYSMSPASLLLTLDAGLRSSPLLVALSAPIFILGNRRAIFLAVAIIISTMIVARFLKQKTLLSRCLATAALSCIIVLASNGAIVMVGTITKNILPNITVFERSERMAGVFDTVEKWVSASNSPITTLEPPSGIAGSSVKCDSKVPNASPETRMSSSDAFLSGRLSQAAAVMTTVNKTWLTTLIGPGFGSTYTWSYFSDNLCAMQVYTFSQADTAIVYFLLTGGVVFAVLLPLLIGLRVFGIFTDVSSGLTSIGALFVIGFAIDMFFSLQPNAPLFWMLLGAFGCHKKINVKTLLFPSRN